MGYNTTHSLKLELYIGGKVAQLVDNAPLDSVLAELLAENENAAYCLDEKGGSNESGKWYEHEADMREFSKKHVGVLFTLHGEGEENGDIWDEFYLNGKMQREKAKVQIAPFNEKLLK